MPQEPTFTRIEQEYHDHFNSQHHTRVRSGSLLNDSAPMSFVMSAGFAQIEQAHAQYTDPRRSFFLVQNCFRHFDLDKIGTDDTHLSFFRMAGSFVFGPIDRQERIADLWQLLTQSYGLPADRLWVTYFSGDTISGHDFEPDEAARSAWLSLGLPPERIVGLDGKHNFWKQNPQWFGPEHAPQCGPHTEVFFDRGPQEHAGGHDCRPGCPCGRFIEFANLLFILWNIDLNTNKLSELAEPFAETVIGLERLAMLLQSAASVFEIDTIKPLLESVGRFCQVAPGSLPQHLYHERILVDHLQALLFLKMDGAPSPKTKGPRAFIIRRLMRNVLVSLELLKINAAEFLPGILEQISIIQTQDHIGLTAAIPELLQELDQEQERFQHTLQRASRKLDRMLLSRKECSRLDGKEVLVLEKDYGVPIHLLNSWLKKRHLAYDQNAYNGARTCWRQEIDQAQKNLTESNLHREERPYDHKTKA